jgi:hypothetical protein
MSKENIINNLYRVITNMFTQFNTDDPLVSAETQRILANKQAREEVFEKILKNPKQGKVKVHADGKDVTFFVEA